jgi:two-component system chemotaxis sensor kinase CheA
LDQSLRDFVAEAEDILENLDESISALSDLDPEDHRKPDILNAVFRHAHSLKGLSGMFNLDSLSSLSHRLENLLDAMRLGKVDLTDEAVDVLGRGLLTLSRMVRVVGEGSTDSSIEYADFIRDLENVVRGDPHRDEKDLSAYIQIPPGLTEMLSEYEEHRFRDNIQKHVPLFRVSCCFPLETFDVQLEKIGSGIKEVGELLTTLPNANAGGSGDIGFTLYFASKSPGDVIRKRLSFSENDLEPVKYCEGGEPVQGTGSLGEIPVKPDDRQSFEEEIRGVSQTVRVDISKLDYLMNLVGELVILKATSAKLTDGFQEREFGIPKGTLIDLEKNNTNMDRKLTELRDAVMDIRMVPMGQLYSRLQRVAKKIARDLGKKVDLEFLGHETELDKMIMEEMVSPLLHIVRNSLDHGIEDGQTRRSRGKSEKGKVRVSAFQRGNHVILEVEDDGGGIDLGKVRSLAVRRGEIRGDETVSEEEVINLLFKPGFSTKDSVTELSGRGVGMDVVRKELENVGGAVEIHTASGRGTRVTLTLPITLAILQALLVRDGTKIFAVPMGSIHETLELGKNQLKTVQGREVITLRDRTIPIIRLESLFDYEEEGSGNYVVIVGMGHRIVGLMATDLIGKQDIVIKPLGDAFAGNVGLAGAADMGDQSTVLVLDIAGLIMEAIRLGAISRGA